MTYITNQILNGAPLNEICTYSDLDVARFCHLTRNEVFQYAHMLKDLGTAYPSKKDCWNFSFKELTRYFVLSSLIRRFGTANSCINRLKDQLPPQALTGEMHRDICTSLPQLFRSCSKFILDDIHRVGYDENGVINEIFLPTRPNKGDSPLTVSVRPDMNFGDPAIAGRGLCIDAIHDRFMAGDSPGALASDYDCPLNLINDAIRAMFLLELVEVDD